MCSLAPTSPSLFANYEERRMSVKKGQDERRGGGEFRDPHAVDVDATVQNCLEPWPVDLTDGPRVGDPCNSC